METTFDDMDRDIIKTVIEEQITMLSKSCGTMSLRFSQDCDIHGGYDNYINYLTDKAFEDPTSLSWRPHFMVLKAYRAIINTIGDDKEIAGLLYIRRDKPLPSYVIDYCKSVKE